ncbi:uncharacterized protein LOC134347289 [Mobula hypostoma]|uniref:uncharacterized protein LOC134347289 n=1 Tax=Mobula hypostoma TaxID=723540 RepID=UPI002FC3D782
MIAALTAGQMISAPSLHSAMLPDQWKWKTLGGLLGNRFYFLSLWISHTLSFIAMYIALIYWLVDKGLSLLDFAVFGVMIVGLQLSSFYIKALADVTEIGELLRGSQMFRIWLKCKAACNIVLINCFIFSWIIITTRLEEDEGNQGNKRKVCGDSIKDALIVALQFVGLMLPLVNVMIMVYLMYKKIFYAELVFSQTCIFKLVFSIGISISSLIPGFYSKDTVTFAATITVVVLLPVVFISLVILWYRSKYYCPHLQFTKTSIDSLPRAEMSHPARHCEVTFTTKTATVQAGRSLPPSQRRELLALTATPGPTKLATSPDLLNSFNTARSTMRFTEAPGVCGLAIFTYLSAVTAALTLRVHQDRVNGTAGQSVLLPVSYTVPDPHGYLRITWTGGGNASVCIEYTCFSGQECHLSDRRSHITVSETCKHRALLFPENASLLLRDLQINDSGIYELSISDSTGTENGSLVLTVRFDGTTSQATDRTPVIKVIKNEVIIPPVVFAAAVIILCLVVKMQRVCKGSHKQRAEGRNSQDHREPQAGDGVLYTEVSWTQQTNAKRKMHTSEDTIVYASVHENSSTGCPGVLYTEVKSSGVTRTVRSKMQIPQGSTEYAEIKRI